MRIDKVAETRFPIHDLLKRRWSPRAFSDRRVEPEKLASLFEAARWAPSSFNEQPWSFIVAVKENPAEFSHLLDCLVEGNRLWAQRASVLVLSVAKLKFDKDREPNRHAFHDIGLAVENLVIQATDLGLGVHQMAGFSVEKARETFKIPRDHEPVAAIAIGYPGDPSTLPDRLRGRELAKRSRRALNAFVFSNQWGQSSSLIATT
jgi:nitroreductase